MCIANCNLDNTRIGLVDHGNLATQTEHFSCSYKHVKILHILIPACKEATYLQCHMQTLVASFLI